MHGVSYEKYGGGRRQQRGPCVCVCVCMELWGEGDGAAVEEVGVKSEKYQALLESAEELENMSLWVWFGLGVLWLMEGW